MKAKTLSSVHCCLPQDCCSCKGPHFTGRKTEAWGDLAEAPQLVSTELGLSLAAHLLEKGSYTSPPQDLSPGALGGTNYLAGHMCYYNSFLEYLPYESINRLPVPLNPA